MKPGQRGAIRRALKRFDNAAQEYAFKGSRHYDDHEEIEDEYYNSMNALERFLGIEETKRN